MNYLAHVFLSGDDNDIMFGNFIGDSIKGNQYENFPKQIKKGILLHRAIDSFTDSHPVYLESKRRFYEDFPKVSGIITDILYDHLLCLEWSRHTGKNINSFFDNTYQVLDSKKEEMPDKMTFIYHHMRTNDWFKRYLTEEGTALSLSQIGKRIGFEKDLALSMDNYRNQKTLFIEEFNSFFVEIKQYANDFMEKT